MTMPTKQITRTQISSFVHSLHLLDLDLLEDWPGVSKETFDSKSNLQHRLRCVEWSLYRLFELYDPPITREKLLPFFPPATSLQSINLRAALFRQLNDLKKDGRLGQNVILRKTMLDECKGDKFEELIATFSILVLKTVKRPLANDRFDVSKTRSQHLLPLIISHRKVIEQDLVKRKELRLKTERQQQSLQAELQKLTIEEGETKQIKTPKAPENADFLHKIVHENWIGDIQWVDAIIKGEPPNEHLSNRSPSTHMLEDDENPDQDRLDVLGELSLRVSMQNVRLVHWQKCLKDLQQTRAVDSTNTNKHVHQVQTLKFSQHQSLSSQPGSEAREQPTLKPEHAILLGSLERDLTDSKRHLQTQNVADIGIKVKSHLRNTPASSYTSRFNTLIEEDIPSFASAEMSSTRRVYGEDLDSQFITDGDVTSSRHVNSKQQEKKEQEQPPTPPRLTQDSSSLLERTKSSLARSLNPEVPSSTAQESISLPREDHGRTITAPPLSRRPDRSSLLERTRESMSLLTSAFEDSSRRKSSGRKSMHSKSKSVNVPSRTLKLEKAWSEESIAPKAAKDDFDVDADYHSVFRSRPKLAMSPNLSPQRNDLFDEFLEEGMKKLTIEPTV